MTVNTAAGSKFFLGTTQAAVAQADFEADSYVEVGEVEDLGTIGDKASEQSFTALGDRRVRKVKTSYDAGTMSVKSGFDGSDDGQAALVAAFATDFDYNIRVELNDQLTIGGTPTILYFRGKVMSKPYTIGAVTNIVRRTFDVGINSAIIEVPAT